ncbi:protein btn1 [Blastomyces parvus]|uniref:Protein btn1 n=1 Tax=Blastomyces parvus TaxID=2060905 RepID=A0A2B7XAF8_9EURO|nr:protein btn1 [Blastomyces parvus]
MPGSDNLDAPMLPLPCASSSSWANFRGRFRALFNGADPRVCAAFWLFGLINNVLYVIILSAALDLVGPDIPKGVVLLADVVPSFFTKLCAPYFIHAIPYPVRILIFVALSACGMLLIALSPAYIPDSPTGNPITRKMLGVILASLSSGGGELSFLGLTHFYGPFSLAAWGSGTGAAGLVGAGAYALATTTFGFSVKITLLFSAGLPLVMLLSFFTILPLGPLKCAEKLGEYEQISTEEEAGEHGVLGRGRSQQRELDDAGDERDGLLGRDLEDTREDGKLVANGSDMSWSRFKANLKKARGLFFPFMLPLLLVYIAEYTINQGVAPTLLYPLNKTPFNHFRAFYPAYNAIYQVGVFISRSSTPFFRIHNLYFPSFLQVINLGVLILHALFNFIPSVYIIFLIIFWEGLLGGLVYVNTFAEISDRVPKKDREFSLGATTVSDSGDHVLGRPSTQFRKIQVFAVVSFWFLYLLRGNIHGPPGIRLLSSRLYKRVTPWQSTVMTLIGLYLSRNFAKLLGLESPEPLANLYSRSYFRATWVTTALDAGFWTAMNIKKKWLRDLASMVFSMYYLIAAEHADEKVRKVRAVMTVEHLRISWNKATTPYLSFLGKLMRPRLMDYAPVQIRIPRPKESSYKEPCIAWLYYNGPLHTLKDQTDIVLDIPGGGFVAMGPRMSDDKLLAWAGRTGVPVLSLDYKKAPEYPYPYALNECYDVYHTIVTSRGRCIGLSGKVNPSIVITGDSAGGNLAAGVTLMVLQSESTNSRKRQGEGVLPPPAGLVLIYPSLDMNIGSWMTEDEMSLIRERGMRETNRNILRRKSEDYRKLTSSRPPSFHEDSLEHPVIHDYFAQQHAGVIHEDHDPAIETENIDKPVPGNTASEVVARANKHPGHIETRLAVSSMISYFNDRVLSPEMMRATIILYIGPYNRPDFSSDFLLSPILAPEALLARFPKTFFLTGERDPLVDDTVIFAGRIRQAKLRQFRERQELGLEKSMRTFDEKAHVEVSLIPGISHGFLQFPALFPEGWRQIFRCSRWIRKLFAHAAERASATERDLTASSMMSFAARRRQGDSSGTLKTNSSSTSITPPRQGDAGTTQRSRTDKSRPQDLQRGLTGESSGDEDRPLEMTRLRMTKRPSASVGVSKPALSSSSPSARSTADASYFPSPSPVAAPERAESPGSVKTALIPSPGPSNGIGKHKHPPQRNGDTTQSSPASLPSPQLTTNGTSGRNQSDGCRPTHKAGDDVDEKEDIVHSWRKRMTNMALHRDESLTSLPSEEDLLGRRMNGLAGGLLGMGEAVKTP